MNIDDDQLSPFDAANWGRQHIKEGSHRCIMPDIASLRPL
jgi:hypothetical protein